MTAIPMMSIGGGLLLLSAFTFGPAEPAPTATDSAPAVAAENRYVGQKVCKNCHKGAEKGEAHEKWQASPHANAFETLASEAAKKIAKDMGIEDAQKSDKCLECHVTAFGVDKKGIKRGFKASDGVQCEACHGPGENHFKTRFKESSKEGDPSPIGADEIRTGRSVELCTRCHNDRSPTYEAFCLKERMAAIEHLDPRKERTEEEIAALRDTCADDCPNCSQEGEDKDADK